MTQYYNLVFNIEKLMIYQKFLNIKIVVLLTKSFQDSIYNISSIA